MPVYCFSDDEELFKFSLETETFEEALAAARATYPGQPVYVGHRRDVNPATWICADDIIDRLADRAYEEVGEATEGWPDFSKEEEAELTGRIQEVIHGWLNKTGNAPTFYAVDSVRKVTADLKPDGPDHAGEIG